jgi:circadian clock protein KaiB
MKKRKSNAGKRQKLRKTPADASRKFESLLKAASAIEHYSLRLYITGTSARSTLAIANIRQLCEEYLPGHYDLEVIDIYQQPIEAMHEQIIAAPTLVKRFPMPPKRLIGNLSDREKIIVGLNLHAKAAETFTTWTQL